MVNLVKNMYVKDKRGKKKIVKKGRIEVLESHFKMTEVCEKNAKDKTKWRVRKRVVGPKWL